jgi:hypothetical protein
MYQGNIPTHNTTSLIAAGDRPSTPNFVAAVVNDGDDIASHLPKGQMALGGRVATAGRLNMTLRMTRNVVNVRNRLGSLTMKLLLAVSCCSHKRSTSFSKAMALLSALAHWAKVSGALRAAAWRRRMAISVVNSRCCCTVFGTCGN